MKWNIWAISPLPVCSRLADQTPQAGISVSAVSGAGTGERTGCQAGGSAARRCKDAAASPECQPTAVARGDASRYPMSSSFPNTLADCSQKRHPK